MPDIERGAGRGGRRRAAGQEARSGRPYHRSIFTRTADSSSIISPPLTPSHRRVPTPSDKAEGRRRNLWCGSSVHEYEARHDIAQHRA
ncbi:Os08g0371800 [Oryza sativa Japonica Group]|uniref:Os08g0371800 protein n=1 Tax=Oryza sativa subsp. japonica TaxID=39947 RepID=A0A0P0XF37_ORYSJ|nr:Os08g0371800 [Oryza sativa Japonica Group]